MAINRCAPCIAHGEYRAATHTEPTDAGDVHLCHHCKGFIEVQKALNELMGYMVQMRQETLEIAKIATGHTGELVTQAEKITKLCERFSGRN